MYIIYLYIIYILFISLSVVSKILSQRTRRMYVTTLLLFVICYASPAKGLPRRGRSDMCYDLIVICYLLFVMIVPSRTANDRPC